MIPIIPGQGIADLSTLAQAHDTSADVVSDTCSTSSARPGTGYRQWWPYCGSEVSQRLSCLSKNFIFSLNNRGDLAISESFVKAPILIPFILFNIVQTRDGLDIDDGFRIIWKNSVFKDPKEVCPARDSAWPYLRIP